MWVRQISHTRACPQSVACKSGINLNCFLSTFVHPTDLCLSKHCGSVTDHSKRHMRFVFHHCIHSQVPKFRPCPSGEVQNVFSPDLPAVGSACCLLQTRLTRREGTGELGTISPSPVRHVPWPVHRPTTSHPGFEFTMRAASLHCFIRTLSALQDFCCRKFLNFAH